MRTPDSSFAALSGLISSFTTLRAPFHGRLTAKPRSAPEARNKPRAFHGTPVDFSENEPTQRIPAVEARAW
jgi:hypothetical protein